MSDYGAPSNDPNASQPPGGQPPRSDHGEGYGFPQYPSGGNQIETSDGGFFKALFDFSFQQFVTPKIVKFVYVLATIVIALGYLVFVIGSFARSAGAGVVVLVLGAIGALVYLAFIRMTLEFYFAIVRMSQDINRRLPGA